MADIATLGIEVRAPNLGKVKSDLDAMSGAAARAEAATEGLAGANRGATGAAAAAAHAYANEGTAAASASKQIELMNRAANQNRGAGGRANVGNIAAQFQDIAVTAAMSMNPLQIALQQGTQLVGVLGAMENPVKGLATAFLSLLSPLSLVTIGLVAAAAAGIQMVNWPKAAGAALRGLAGVLGTIAPYAIGAAAALALLYSPAIIGGVIQLIALLGRLVVQLAAVTIAFAAANPAVAFVLGITAAVAAANIFRDELAQIFGRDIVADAKSGVNAIIGAFIGGYQGIKAAWSALPSALSDVVYSTATAVIKGIESMVNAVASKINDFIAGIEGTLKQLPFGMGEGVTMGRLNDKMDFGGVTNPNPGAAAGLQDGVMSAIKGAQGKDYLGSIVAGIASAAGKGSAALKDLAGWMTKVDDKGKKKGGAGGKSETEKYSDIVNGANRRIASLKAESDAIGMTEEAAAKLQYQQDLLNEAQSKGITLTSSQRSELSELAGKMAGIESETRRAKEALDDAKDATKGFLGDLRQGLMNGEGFWKSFGSAALNVLNKILDKIEGQLVDALFSLGGSGSSSRGSIFGSLLGGIGKLFGFANGTPSAPGGLAWVGERGPEIINVPRGSQVVPNHRLGSVAPANSNHPEKVDINVNVSGARGNQEIQEMVSAGVRNGIGQYDKGLPTRIGEINERTG
ncbi:phage tail tape-measure protein [Neorhizobium lilium]|uniref:Phage tail tape-measure protein n=1 Tax=Neorhizobium lilium TaxID=2503024 RepID=A0A444LA16_9HYPH|nr:phage tail length tape measure family protein [Neorhizobium lilium]RWX74442.1 phage tail tape-measure protein [Neorhizobium lilium]